jgi:hypothetical protein
MKEQLEPAEEAPANRDGWAALAIALVAAVLVAVVINHFV